MCENSSLLCQIKHQTETWVFPLGVFIKFPLEDIAEIPFFISWWWTCFSSPPMSYRPSIQWSGTVPIPIFLLIFSRPLGSRPKSVPSFLPGRVPSVPLLVPGALPQHLLFPALFCCKGSSLLGYILLAASDIFDQSSNIFACCFQASWYFHRVFWTQTPGRCL